MKKLIATTMFLISLSSLAMAECKEAPGMAKNFYRCENTEAICYFFSEPVPVDQAAHFPISCFPKK